MVVVVLEYGVVLVGDKMQMFGLCDILSSGIIYIFVGIKLIGMKVLQFVSLVVVSVLSSYLVILELVVCMVDGKVFSVENVDW